MEITKEQKEAIEYSKNCLMKITLINVICIVIPCSFGCL